VSQNENDTLIIFVTASDLFYPENNSLSRYAFWKDQRLVVETSFLDLEKGYSSKSGERELTRKTNFDRFKGKRCSKIFFHRVEEKGRLKSRATHSVTNGSLSRSVIFSYRMDIRAYLLFLEPVQNLSLINT